MNLNLANVIYKRSLSSPDSLAAACEGVELSYAELAAKSVRLARLLEQTSEWNRQDNLQRVGILASRSLDACIAMLGSCWAGATYVPISLSAPENRIIEIINNCALSAIVVDARGVQLLSRAVLDACPRTVVVPDASRLPAIPPATVDVCSVGDEAVTVSAPANRIASDIAYIIHTSGTSGAPKGVVVSVGAVRHYIEAVSEFLALTPEDRALETCELSFDASVHNMFSTWEAGASLHILPAVQVLNAVKFAQNSRLTVWNSVPSLVGMLRRLGSLRPHALSNIRLAVFGGEQLSLGTVDAWRIAAPDSDVKNLYGPTEATVYCLCQTVSAPAAVTPGRDVIPVGVTLRGNKAFIVDESGYRLGDGETGELAIAGPQVAEGYLQLPELNTRKFPTLDGERVYLTGDLAMRDASGIYHCLGRKDNQVKVLGHRIELEEIEAHLRVVAQANLVGVVAWPIVDGLARGIVAFVATVDIDPSHVRDALASRLPAYMLPAQILAVQDMPLNQNGKVDRRALVNLLELQAA